MLGFVWLSNTELMFITDLGLELYSVHQEKRTVKYVRSVSENINWYTCYGPGHVVVTSGSADTCLLHVWTVRGGNITKLPSINLPQVNRTRVLFYSNLHLSKVTMLEIYS